jgi:hypothetical protein
MYPVSVFLKKMTYRSFDISRIRIRIRIQVYMCSVDAHPLWVVVG